MPDFLVRWTINETAPNEREAAEAVRAEFFKLTGACVYDVQPISDELGARWSRVDLAEPPSQDDIIWEFPHQTLFRMAQKIEADGGDIHEVIEMLEKPWKWRDLLTSIVLDTEFDKVSPVAEEADLSDPETEDSTDV